MQALDNLINRVSHPALQEPGPSTEQLDNMFKAALRAPDHGAIRPWRYLVVQGEARAALGELYARGGRAADPQITEEKLTKLRKMPLRAPVVVIAIANPQAHSKVPVIEQQVSAGAGVQSLILAAHAQGVGAMWRTGEMAYNRTVMQGLGLEEHEEIIGYVYLGTPMAERNPPHPPMSDFVQEWTGA